MKTIGITGGIASGKSLVSDYLISLGAKVICADDITHMLYLPNALGSIAIKNNFGVEYIDKSGGVDRKKLGELVFNDKKSLEKLNDLMHPIIFDEIEKFTDDSEVIFIDAALLIESGLYKKFDRVWLVVTNLYERIRRLKLRDNFSDDIIDKIINSQMTDVEKSKFADKIIDNSFSIEETYTQVKKLYSDLLLKEENGE